jgi:uncharacterized damage-inducible protein DinB
MLPEPWMRGPIPGVNPLVAPILYTFQHAREDLAKHTEGLTPDQLWASPHGFASVGFHIRHIAGSTGRLLTYLQGGALTADQLREFDEEKRPLGIPREELLALLDRALADAEVIIRAIDPTALSEPRAVGRQRLPTTVIGLLIHIAEHTQRHVGQAISAAKWSRL